MFTLKFAPSFTDTDALGHINNTRLPVWFERARNDLFKLFTADLDPKKWRLILASIKVDFLGELFYGEDIEIRTYLNKIGNSSFVVVQEAWQNGKMGSRGEAILVHYSFEKKASMPIEGELREALTAHLIPAES